MEAKKILAQVRPAATVGNYMYTVPDSMGAVISSIIICNTGTSTALVKINALKAPDASAGVGNAIYFELIVAAKTTIEKKIGVALSNADKIYVESDAATVTYTLFGAEFNQPNVYAP